MLDQEIFQAAEEHDLKTIKFFLKEGGNVNLRDQDGKSLLVLALQSQVSDVETEEELPLLLLNHEIELHGSFSIDDQFTKCNVLHLAIVNSYKKVAKIIIGKTKFDLSDKAEDQGDGWFRSAVITRSRVTNDFTIISRHHVDAYFLENATALHYASMLGDIESVKAICAARNDLLNATASLVLNKDLLEDVEDELSENADDEEYEHLGFGWSARESWPITRTRGITPLHLAARAGNLEVVQYLIAQGADFAKKDGESYTLLDHARFGKDEFVDEYEGILRGDLSLDCTSDAPQTVVEKIRIRRENDIDRDLKQLLKSTNPEEKSGNYQRTINYVENLLLQPKDVSLSKAMQKLGVSNSKNIIDSINQLEIHRQLYAEKRFFDIQRNKHQKTHVLATQFFHNRYGNDKKTIETSNVPLRRLITADAESVRQSIQNSGGENKLLSQQDIEKNLKWPFSYSPKFGNQYPWQNLAHGSAKVSFKHAPVPGHLGGFFMIISKEGHKYINIMSIIDGITGGNPLVERFLARSMIIFNQTGYPMPRTALRRMGVNLNEQQYEVLIRICFLTSYKEITRRMFTGKRSNGAAVPELPFATAHARALRLIREGHLRMSQVFSQDADFGIAAGEKITGENLERTLEKLAKINKLYNEKILLNKRPSFLCLKNPNEIASVKEIREELSDYGGDYDSDGEGYDEDHLAKLKMN